MTRPSIATGLCDYCGLPLPRPLFRRRAEPVSAEGPSYCCSGCRFAASVTRERGAEGAASWTLTSLGLAIFFSMSVMVFTIALWSFDLYDSTASSAPEMPAAFADLLRWLCLLFALPVLFLLGKPLAIDGLQHLRRGIPTSDLLLLTGVIAAYAYSTWNVLRGEGSVYFETGCVILVFVTLGRWLAATGRLQVTALLDRLQRLLPERIRRMESGAVVERALDDVRPGDRLVVQAGERLPVDGVIRCGAAALDEQVFTGESIPVERRVGEPVFAGTLNLDGTIQVEATARPREGAFGALLEAVRTARESRGRYQTAADRISRLFFPVITVIAAATVAGHAAVHGWTNGWLAGLSVVLIACPCALALATPLAMWAALGRAARRGVLFRSGEAVERLTEVRAIRFDKTGTLTTGTPVVLELHVAPGADRGLVHSQAAALAVHSPHVFSQAIAREAAHEGITAQPLDSARSVPGCGVEANLSAKGESWRIGRWDWLEECGATAPADLKQAGLQAQHAGRPIVAVAVGDRICGLFVLAEELRPGVRPALQRLQQVGLDVGILTGDHPWRAAQLAENLGVQASAALSPAEKARTLARVQEQIGPVAMVGDGINDAPALAAADVGIALGCGTDVTRDSADICLLGNDLAALPWALELAQQTVRVVRGNLAWAFGYNAIGVVLAAAGWLHPSVAAVLMVVSSVVVISRSMRLGHEPEDSASARERTAAAGPPASSSNAETSRPLQEAAP